MEDKIRKAAGRRRIYINYHELKRYIANGLTVQEIAARLKCSVSTVYKAIKQTGIEPDADAITTKEDCSRCIYSGKLDGDIYCNYLCITGHMRNCSARACNVIVRK